MKGPTLSLCMIVRNEEENLPLCLEGVHRVVDEVVVVDTGSEDGTVEVAKRFGARVYSLPWADDFSAARNESVRRARGDYILWLDGDDRVPEESGRSLLLLKERLPAAKDLACGLKVDCRGRHGESAVYYQLRIFPRLPGVEFRGCVHEEVAPSLHENGIRIVREPITIVHTGYEGVAQARAKARRNLRILLCSTKDPTPKEHYQLAQSYFGIQEYGSCLEHLLRARGAGRDTDFYKESYPLLANTYLQLHRGEEALAMLRQALEEFPGCAYFRFLLGGALALQGSHGEAVRELDAFADSPRVVEDFPVPTPLEGRRLYFLGRCFEGLGDTAKAAETYRKALESTPWDTDALKALGFLLCGQGRFGEGLAMFRKCRELSTGTDKAVQLAMARICLSRGGEEEARGLYEEILLNDPQDEDALAGLAETRLRQGAACTVASTPVRDIGADLEGTDPPVIAWEGTQFFHHSLAILNREIALALVRSGRCRLTLHPYEPDQFGVEEDPERLPLVRAHVNRSWGQPVDCHVRHLWPPDFSPPPEGHWIHMQPWEYGSMPSSWLPHLRDEVDDIWVYSSFVREGFIHDGIDPDRIAVIAPGVDYGRFNPGAPPLERVKGWTGKGFRFLFVGGTLWRKGVDTLLEAYRRAFCARDDVALLIKETGADSFYRGQGMGDRIRETQEDPGAPEIVHIRETLAHADIPRLYTACDCLVHPYRGEGFGMPIAEAMACGLPVIIPRGGAADDFTSEETVCYVPSGWMKVRMEEETVNDPVMLSIDPAALAERMRSVFLERDEPRSKGARASRAIRSLLGWERSAETILERLQSVRRRPVRRFARGAQQGPVWRAGSPRERAEAFNREGLAQYSCGNLERAELQFVRAAQTDEGFGEPHNNLAVLYWGRGLIHDALKELAEALRLDPSNPDALANIRFMHSAALTPGRAGGVAA